MKQVTVISGKGGTGKTSLTASFASLAENKIIVDCDVDAADLHILLHPKDSKMHDYYGGKVVNIDNDLCMTCNQCALHCRYDAITFKDWKYIIDPILCEGCGVCNYICPVSAFKMEEKKAGQWFESKTSYGTFIHAKLAAGEETSGKLITLMREKAKVIAKEKNNDLIIIDGSPGIGCPVIASITGVDIVCIITEATVSGLHDLKRILELVNHFNIKSVVCINKYDLNEALTEQIEKECEAVGSIVIGKIPYDTDFYKAQLNGQSIIEYTDNEVSRTISHVWQTLHKELDL